MKPAARVTAIFLTLVAFAHLIRITFGVSLVVGGHEVPVWTSVLAVLAPLALAFWLWAEQRG